MSSVRAVTVRDCAIGGPELVVMAGPCAVESREQIFEAAEIVAASGARFLRGGAFKVRTAPTAFQGLGLDGWRLLREAADAYGLLTVSEILAEEQIDGARRYVDLAQIGSRNMQNVPLLKARSAARACRCCSSAASAARSTSGCTPPSTCWRRATRDVVLCERGIRTFETATRFTLDVAAVPIAQEAPRAPRDRRPLARRRPARLGASALTLAGVAVRRRRAPDRDPPRPGDALSDGPQAVVLAEFPALMEKARRVAHAMGRTIPAGARVEAAAC